MVVFVWLFDCDFVLCSFVLFVVGLICLVVLFLCRWFDDSVVFVSLLCFSIYVSWVCKLLFIVLFYVCLTCGFVNCCCFCLCLCVVLFVMFRVCVLVCVVGVLGCCSLALRYFWGDSFFV